MLTRPALAVLALLTTFCVVLAADAPNVTGKWTWTQTRPDGTKVTVVLTLKQDGQKLTGSYHGEGPDSEIFDGSVKGNDVAFSVKREIEKHNVTLTYTGKLEGNAITGKMNAHVGFKHREENWEAVRIVEKD